MTKVLVFTYYWPPSGGPAVQRWLALTEHLPSLGIEPIIITVDEKYASYFLLDPALEKRIPKNTRVFKTKTFEILSLYKKSVGQGVLPTAGFANESQPGLLKKAARWVRGNLFFPDPRKAWNKYAIKAAKKLIKEENIQAVITAGPPQSTHLIGQQLQKEFNLFWICDFHDAWVNVWYYNELFKTNIARKIDLRMEREVLEKADYILTVGRQIIQDFSQKITDSSKIHLHSMGYDEERFGQGANPSKTEFTISYTGTMASHYQPKVFFQAIKELSQESELKLCVNFYGLIADDIQEEVQELGLDSMVHFAGYVSHNEVVEALMSSCMLLLVSPNTPQAKMIIPGKIYEYMATRLPILNLASSETESALILDECQAGMTFSRDQKSELKSFINHQYKIWEEDASQLLNQDKTYLKYGRKTEAALLAKLILQGS